MIDQQAQMHLSKAKATAFVKIPMSNTNPPPQSYRHQSQPQTRPVKFKKLNMVGGFHQDISETTLPKIKLKDKEKEKGTRHSKIEKITYIKPIGTSHKKQSNLISIGQVKEPDNVYPYLKDNSLYSNNVHKSTFERRKKSNLSDYNMSDSQRQTNTADVNGNIKMSDFSTAHLSQRHPDILSRYNAQRLSNEEFKQREKMQTNQLIMSSRRRQKEQLKKKKQKQGSINLTTETQEEIKKFSNLKKAYQTEQVDGEKIVRTAMGVQGAYDSNPEQSTDNQYNVLQNYNNITIKPGTQQNENNITIPGTLYPVSQRPPHRIKLKEKRGESASAIKANPFKSSSPQKTTDSNPYFERQMINLQGQSHYENYYKPSGNDKVSDYMKNIKKIIGAENKQKEDVFATYMDSIMSENANMFAGDATSNLTRPPRKLSKLNVDNLTVNDVATIVSHNKLQLNHQRSQISSLMSENDQTMTMEQEAKTSKQQVHLNKKLINILKNANSNLQQFNDLMQSPTRDKKEVVVDIDKNIRKILSKKNLRDDRSERSGNTRSVDNFTRFTGSVALKKQDTLVSLRSKKSLMSPSIISSKFQSRRGTKEEETTPERQDQMSSIKFKNGSFVRKITKDLKKDLGKNDAQSRQKFAAVINKDSIQYLTQKDIQNLTKSNTYRNEAIMESHDVDASMDDESEQSDFRRDEQNNSQLSLKQNKESQKYLGLLSKQQKSTSKLEKLTQQFIKESQNMVNTREQVHFGSQISGGTPMKRVGDSSPSTNRKGNHSKNLRASRNVYRELDYDEMAGGRNDSSNRRSKDTYRKSKDTTDVQDLKNHTFQNFKHVNEYETIHKPEKMSDVKRSHLDINRFNDGVYSIESTLHKHGIVQDNHTVGGPSKNNHIRPSTNAFQDDTFYNPNTKVYESTGRSESLMSGQHQRSIQLGDNALAYRDKNFQNVDYQSDQPYNSNQAQNILTRPSKEIKQQKKKPNKTKKKDSPVQDKIHLIQQYLKPINDLGTKGQRQKDRQLENKMLKTRKTSANKRLKYPNAQKATDKMAEQPSKGQEHLDTTNDADSQPEASQTLEDVALKEKQRLKGITQQTAKTPQPLNDFADEEDTGTHTPLRNFKIDLKNLNKNSEKEYIAIQANDEPAKDSKSSMTPHNEYILTTQDHMPTVPTPNAQEQDKEEAPEPPANEPQDQPNPYEELNQQTADNSKQTLDDDKNSKKYRKTKQKGTPQIKGAQHIKEVKGKLTKVTLKKSTNSKTNLHEMSAEQTEAAPASSTRQQHPVSSTLEQPKSFDPEGGIPSSSNPVSILKSPSPPMYNTLSNFKALKDGSAMASRGAASKSPDSSLHYSQNEQMHQTAKEKGVGFQIDKHQRRKTQDVQSILQQNPYSNIIHLNETINEARSDGVSSGASSDQAYATTKFVDNKLDKLGLATQRPSNNKFQTLQFSGNKRRQSVRRQTLRNGSFRRKSLLGGDKARESQSEVSGMQQSVQQLEKTHDKIEDQFKKIQMKFQNINELIIKRKSGIKDPPANKKSDRSEKRRSRRGTITGDMLANTLRRANQTGDFTDMNSGSKRSMDDSGDNASLGIYTKLNKTTPSNSLQKSYQAALMLTKIEEQNKLSKIHESARNFQNSELLKSSKHFEPSTPIIVEASQILEDSQSQVKLRMPGHYDQQMGSPMEKTVKDIIIEQMDSSFNQKRQADHQENIVKNEFKAQFEAVTQNNND